MPSKAPKRCDACGEATTDLRQFHSDLPGRGTIWNCIFCRNFLSPGTDRNRNLAVMGHILLRAIKGAEENT